MTRRMLPASAAAQLVIERSYGRNKALNAHLAALRANGWTCAELANVLDITAAAISARTSRADWSDLPRDAQLPEAPPHYRVSRHPKPPRHTIKPAIAERMRELHGQARHVNGSVSAADPARAAGNELARIMHALTRQGIQIQQIAHVLGVTHYAVRSFLARRGYLELPESTKHTAYKGTTWHEAPGHRERPERCRQGHPLSGPNLRLVNGDGRRRACRECNRLAVARYRQRVAERAEAAS